MIIIQFRLVLTTIKIPKAKKRKFGAQAAQKGGTMPDFPMESAPENSSQ